GGREARFCKPTRSRKGTDAYPIPGPWPLPDGKTGCILRALFREISSFDRLMPKATTEETLQPDASPADAAAQNGDAAEPQLLEASVAEPAVEPAEELKAEAAKWKDMALRSAAELDNYRKRVARESQDARAYANAELLRSLLPILDT